MKKINLGRATLTETSQPYIIAEVGVNHEGSLRKAQEMIVTAAASGADAVKFQTYKAEKLAIKESPAYWDLSQEPTLSQRELFKKFDGFDEFEYRSLKRTCDECNVDFVSTPFDLDSLNFLDGLVPFFKIASADINNIPLLKAVGSTGKVVLFSTGASEVWEINQAVETLLDAGASDVIPLHCILNYPTAYQDARLGGIKQLAKFFPDLFVGYSDHTFPDAGMLTLTTSVLMGAKVVEKHYTYDKSLKGNDHYHAMDSNDLAVFSENIKRIWTISKSLNFGNRSNEEQSNQNARRSIVAINDIPSGQIIEPWMLTCKRPGDGISPVHWDSIIGRVALKEIKGDTKLLWSDFD